MSWLIVTAIIFVTLFVFPAGRRVLLVALGIIYIPSQHFFMWLQKINLGLKDKDPLGYYISCIVIYPLYGIIIVFSQFYEKFSEIVH